MKAISLLQISDRLAAAERILIVTHEKPDGDALGSCFALHEMLKTAGKNARLLLPDPMPDKFLPLIRTFDYCTELEEAGSYDLIAVLDCARAERAKGLALADIVEKTPEKVLNIDHHVDNNMRNVPHYVAPEAAAAALIIYDLSVCGGFLRLTKIAADWLLLGLVTDTGSFRFANTDAAAFRCAAALLEAGADLEKIMNAAFFSNSLNQQKFEAELVQKHLQSEFGGLYVHAEISRTLLDKYHFNMKDGETVIELLRQIGGVKVAALFYEIPSGVKVSLRSKDKNISVGAIAREMGGGGHELAAGISLKGSGMAQAQALLREKVKDILEK